MDNDLQDKYIALYDVLKGIINTSQQRIIEQVPDSLFIENVNFFVKAYLINICTYLESFLQEIALRRAKAINEKIFAAKIPHNYMHWRLATKKYEKSDYSFSRLEVVIDSEMISSVLSANVHKTIDLFRNLGVDLKSSGDFVAHKNLVGSVVTKRNNIIHHNDSASDVTFTDLLGYIEIFVLYLTSINKAVSEVDDG